VTSSPDDLRARALAARLTDVLGLDLSGLTVLTEAATGPYLWTPLLAARAGADRVIAVTRDSRYGRKEDVASATNAAARGWSVDVDVRFELDRDAVAAADIITNSGFVRPISREMISWMKASAVVPLMWETWELRDSDLDLAACRKRGIAVLGTDESAATHELYGYGGFLALKLLFELGLEGYKSRVILLGGGAGLGRPARELLDGLGIPVAWFADDEPGAAGYDRLAAFVDEHVADYDALLVLEHRSSLKLLGEDGLLDPVELAAKQPALRIGIVSGNVDGERLRASGLRVEPDVIRELGFMSYQASDLGIRPVLELYAAGLKVGEELARARLAGMSVAEAEAFALERSPAMAFTGTPA
jgi:hypothetical protein